MRVMCGSLWFKDDLALQVQEGNFQWNLNFADAKIARF